jgi:type I restriction enzyme S subunit
MITDLKPYAEYKESGLPWLGQVPRHWEERRLRSLTTESICNGVGESAQEFREDWPRYIRITDIADARNLRSRSRASLPHSLAIGAEVRQGDLLIAAVGATYGKAYVHASEEEACFAGYLVRVRLSAELDTGFAAYWTESQHYWHQLRANVIQSTIQNFSAARVKRLLAILPPAEEQAAIVRFLDWANGRLERAIRAKRKVIALLNEQKQAIIHRAVTRGLDPSVPLKDSGVPWLGEIPAHWEVRRLKSLSRFVTSGSRGWARYYADAGLVFLRIGNISTTSVDLRLKRITYVMPPAGAEGERTRAIPDDVLLSITAQIGAVGVVPYGLGEAFVNQHTALIRLRPERVVPRWAAYGLLSQFGKDQCRMMTNGGTKIGLTLNDVRCLLVPLPPVEEQLKLVAGIEDRTREQDLVISRLEREISLLREYRTRLVADVVTGKLDVRAAAAALPDEALLDDIAVSRDPDDDAHDTDDFTDTEGEA